MSEPYLLGVDIGTSQSKGVLCDTEGCIVAAHSCPHGVEMPHPGWYEHDAEKVWWGDFITITRALIKKTGVDPKNIAAVCPSGLGQDVIPVDRNGTPTRKNAILYGIDTRALAEQHEMNEWLGEAEILSAAANALSTHSVGPKIAWLRRHEPEAWQSAACFLTASSYIVSKLTGKFVLDHNQASFWVPLYDFQNRRWNSRFCESYVDVSRLPELKWEYEIAGGVTSVAAGETGLSEGTPVCAGAGDAFAESLSVGILHPGEMMAMYGSTTCLFMQTEDVWPDAKIWSYQSYAPGLYGVAMCTATSGAVTKWFRDTLARDCLGKQDENRTYEALVSEALSSPPGANGLLLLPYFSGERSPVYDPYAKGILYGLSVSTTRADMFRAVIEGIAYSIRHNLEMLRRLGHTPKKMVAVGGGVKNPLWLSAVSDICHVVQYVPAVTIGAAYADAYIAGVGAGIFSGVEGISSWVRYEKTVEPDPSYFDLYDEGFHRYLDLYENTKSLNQRP